MISQKLLRQVIGVIWLALSLVGCNSLPTTPVSIPPTSTLASPAATLTSIMPLLSHQNEGYALRYPPEYHVVIYDRSVCFTLAQVIDGRPGACHVASAFLDVSDAGGRTLETAADEAAAQANPDIEVTRTSVRVANEDAILLDNIYAYDLLRKLVLLHNDRVYIFTFVAWVTDHEDFPRLEKLYSTLTESLVFLEIP